MLDIQYIRYDATRTRKIYVQYQDFFDETAMQDVVYFGLRIYTHNDSVAEIFGVETAKDDAVVRAAHLEPASRQKITQSPGTKQTLLLKALFNRGFFLAPRWVHMI